MIIWIWIWFNLEFSAGNCCARKEAQHDYRLHHESAWPGILCWHTRWEWHASGYLWWSEKTGHYRWKNILQCPSFIKNIDNQCTRPICRFSLEINIIYPKEALARGGQIWRYTCNLATCDLNRLLKILQKLPSCCIKSCDIFEMMCWTLHRWDGSWPKEDPVYGWDLYRVRQYHHFPNCEVHAQLCTFVGGNSAHGSPAACTRNLWTLWWHTPPSWGSSCVLRTQGEDIQLLWRSWFQTSTQERHCWFSSRGKDQFFMLQAVSQYITDLPSCKHIIHTGGKRWWLSSWWHVLHVIKCALWALKCLICGSLLANSFAIKITHKFFMNAWNCF